jgi:acetoacetyl-CoA synthetase
MMRPKCRAPVGLRVPASILPKTCCATGTTSWPWSSGEDRVRRNYTYAQLYDEVARVARPLKDAGVQGRRPGGRLYAQHAGIDHRHAGGRQSGGGLVVLLAGFRHQGRPGPLRPDQPRVLFTADGYFFKGKPIDSLARIADIIGRIPSVERLVVIPYVSENRISAPSPMPC